MKQIIYILFLLFITTNIKAQQLPLYSQYMLNDYVINPAIAGTQNYFQAKSNNRYQWVGIVDAPRTYILSVYGPHKSKDIGYGGYVFSDVTGPTSRTGVMLSYAYNFKLNDDIKVSFGLSAGLLQFKIDGSKITLHDDGDPSLGYGFFIDYIPDANLGGYLYSDKYYFGISARQLLGNKVKFNELTTQGLNKLKNHFYMHGGYKYDINSDFQVEPSVIIKYMNPAPLQIDINAKVIYKQMVWLGGSWRSADAFSVLVGYLYNDQIMFGYSYDFTTSNIKNYSSGTHELMIGAKFNKIKKDNESKAKIQ